MPKLVLIRGNAASGKTSLAKILQQELGQNTLLLSQDSLRRDMLLAHDGADTPTIPLLSTLLHHAHAHCEVAILEGILRSDWYAPVFDSIKSLYGQSVYSYHYDLPFEETIKRHLTRDKAKDFGEEALRRWWRDRDYLTQWPEIRFSTAISLEQAKERILIDIAKG